MSAFTPLRSLPNNPITTQEYHTEQTKSIAFNPNQGIHITRPITTGSVGISEKTHFQPIKTNNSYHSSPEIFEPPAIKRTKRDAPMMPDF